MTAAALSDTNTEKRTTQMVHERTLKHSGVFPSVESVTSVGGVEKTVTMPEPYSNAPITLALSVTRHSVDHASAIVTRNPRAGAIQPVLQTNSAEPAQASQTGYDGATGNGK